MSALWHEKEIAALKALSEHGATLEEAAAIIVCRSRDAIRRKATERNLPLKGVDPEINEEALKKFLKGRN